MKKSGVEEARRWFNGLNACFACRSPRCDSQHLLKVARAPLGDTPSTGLDVSLNRYSECQLVLLKKYQILGPRR